MSFTIIGRHGLCCIGGKRPLLQLAQRAASLSTIVPSATTTAITTPMRFYDKGSTVAMLLPLPSHKGLTPVSLPSKATIKDLTAKLRTLDEAIGDIEVINAWEQKLAASTGLGDGSIKELSICFGDTRLRVVNEKSAWEAASMKPEQLKAFRLDIESKGKVKLSKEDFIALCKQYGADNDLADRWQAALMTEGLVASVDATQPLESASQGHVLPGQWILLNPAGHGFTAEMEALLKEDRLHLEERVLSMEDEIAKMTAEEKRLIEIEDSIVRKARFNANLKKGVVLAGGIAQFGTLAYYVYEVYSWDVMEPLSYFLMLTYTVGGSIYFGFKKQQASYENLLKTAIAKKCGKLASQLGYDVDGHAKLSAKITQYKDVVDVMLARLKN